MTRRRFVSLLAGAGAGSAAAIGARPGGVSALAGAGSTERPTPVRSAALSRAFASPIGAWQAGDVPHAHPLPDGRTLWLLNDSFLADDPHGPLTGDSRFVRNVAFLEEAGRVTLVDRGAGADAGSFLADGEVADRRWWWFHGGEVAGSALHVVTTEMLRTGPSGWAINFEPVRTWITTIAWRTGEVLALRPAPNDGVSPVYGFSVASDEGWTYLFGNHHLYGRSTTDTYVARVPRGELLSAPSYWDGRRWVADAAAAAVVHTGGEYARRLGVIRHGGRWIATAKDEEFFGDEALVLEAAEPTGPWEVVRRLAIPTATGDDRTCTYDVMAAPLDQGRLLLWWSNNAYDEALVRADPSIYRPSFTALALP